jgi:hypothetical protein
MGKCFPLLGGHIDAAASDSPVAVRAAGRQLRGDRAGRTVRCPSTPRQVEDLRRRFSQTENNSTSGINEYYSGFVSNVSLLTLTEQQNRIFFIWII